MYRELLSAGEYDNAYEYAQLLSFAREEYEEELAEEQAKEEYERECLIEQQESEDKYISIGVTDDCKNLEESYGEICVRCNKCGRFDEEKAEENGRGR
jgi:hypothetical protein